MQGVGTRPPRGSQALLVFAVRHSFLAARPDRAGLDPLLGGVLGVAVISPVASTRFGTGGGDGGEGAGAGHGGLMDRVPLTWRRESGMTSDCKQRSAPIKQAWGVPSMHGGVPRMHGPLRRAHYTARGGRHRVGNSVRNGPK